MFGMALFSVVVGLTSLPVNAKEFPKVTNYPASFRYTLKMRVAAGLPQPALNNSGPPAVTERPGP